MAEDVDKSEHGRLRSFFGFMKKSVQEYIDDNASDNAAALSFYGAFSIAPLIVIATAIAGFIFGEQAARGELAEQLEVTVGPEAALFIQSMVEQASAIGTGIVATVIGVAVLIWGGVKVFMAIQRALDDMWDLDEDDEGWRQSARDKVRSVVMVVASGGFLIALLLVSVVVTAVSRILPDFIPTAPIIWESLHLGLVFLLLVGVFGVLFRFLPRVEPQWKHVWVGAAVTAVFFLLGRWLVGIYLTETTTASIFGAAGAFAIVLLWFYYMAQIFYFGAEITKVYAQAEA